MTESKKQRLARELDTCVRCLRLTGLNNIVLFAATADRMDDFKALMDAAGPGSMDSFAGRLTDLRHYAVLLTGIAASIYSGTITVPE